MSVACERPLDQALALIAGLCNGLAVNLLDPSLPRAALGKLCRHARSALLLSDDTIAPSIDAGSGTCVRTWRQVFSGEAAGADLPPAPDGALLVYTSGTTGPSKGVLLPWSHLSANVQQAVRAFGHERGSVTGSLLPRFHTFTLISDLLPALFVGGRCVLTDTFEIAHAASIVAAFERHRVASYSAAPIILEALCALGALKNLKALRHAIAGAAPLKERTRRRYEQQFGHPILPCYGLSETTCFATISPPHAIRPGSVGRAAGIEIRAVDEQGAPLPPGAVGELAMRGPSVIADGYFRDADGSFKHAFSPDGWFRSGDIGRIDDDGYVYLMGRRKNMVIRGGEKVYLEELDLCMAELPQVADCASTVQSGPDQADRALAFIVTHDGAPVPTAELAAHIRARLGPRHLPDRVYTVRKVPRTHTGKASHPELHALAARLQALPGDSKP